MTALRDVTVCVSAEHTRHANRSRIGTPLASVESSIEFLLVLNLFASLTHLLVCHLVVILSLLSHILVLTLLLDDHARREERKHKVSDNNSWLILNEKERK